MSFNLIDFLKQSASSPELLSRYFPMGKNYSRQYDALDLHLVPIHSEVVAGAVATDGGLLNDHGPEHIKTVIKHASSLLACHSSNCHITPYEAYLLLCAIQFHDVGNIAGRYKHEHRHIEVMKEFRVVLGSDSSELRMISRIAHAHGGKTATGSSDKIGILPLEEHIHGFEVRPRILAAILRFADELADDKSRANSYLLNQGTLPKESEVFHKYADSIVSVNIKPTEGSVILKYCITLDDMKRTWGKKSGAGVTQVYLVDEIYDRTMKMHLELTYCSRFLKQLLSIDRISATIEVYEDPESIGDAPYKIAYRLEESGYPGAPPQGIYSMCNDLKSGKDWAEELSKESA